jgi:hypothetical protein
MRFRHELVFRVNCSDRLYYLRTLEAGSARLQRRAGSLIGASRPDLGANAQW